MSTILALAALDLQRDVGAIDDGDEGEEQDHCSDLRLIVDEPLSDEEWHQPKLDGDDDDELGDGDQLA